MSNEHIYTQSRADNKTENYFTSYDSANGIIINNQTNNGLTKHVNDASTSSSRGSHKGRFSEPEGDRLDANIHANSVDTSSVTHAVQNNQEIDKTQQEGKSLQKPDWDDSRAENGWNEDRKETARIAHAPGSSNSDRSRRNAEIISKYIKHGTSSDVLLQTIYDPSNRDHVDKGFFLVKNNHSYIYSSFTANEVFPLSLSCAGAIFDAPKKVVKKDRSERSINREEKRLIYYETTDSEMNKIRRDNYERRQEEMKAQVRDEIDRDMQRRPMSNGRGRGRAY